LEGAATAGAAVAAEGFLEEGLARGGVAVAPGGEGGGDVLELARVGWGVLGCAQAVVAGSARGVVGVAEVGDEQARAAEMGLRVAQHGGEARSVLSALLLVAAGGACEVLDAGRFGGERGEAGARGL